MAVRDPIDSSASEVGPAVRVEVRRSHRTLHLADGTTIRRGDRIGVLHLNNERVVALHAVGLPAIAVGLEFRRQLRASLHALATRMSGGRTERRAGVRGAVLLAFVTSAYTFARVKSELVAVPPPTPPKTLVIGEVKVADSLWEQHRLQLRRSIEEWFKRNGGFESVLAERPAQVPPDSAARSRDRKPGNILCLTSEGPQE